MSFTVPIDQMTASSGAVIDDFGRSDSVFALPADSPVAVSRSIPPLSDPEQAYFWAADWQAAERAADAELARGEAPTFTTLGDGMRWLLSADE
jgi:hypothetical protein